MIAGTIVAGQERYANLIKMKFPKTKVNEVLKQKLMPALIGGIALFVVFYNMRITPANVALFSSFGATTVILSAYPTRNMAKLKTVLLSYFLATLCGFAASFISYLPLAAGVGVSMTILLMLLFNVTHPPAAGMTLTFIFSSAGYLEMIYVVSFVLMLIILLKFVINFYFAGEHIDKFKHEKYSQMNDKK